MNCLNLFPRTFRTLQNGGRKKKKELVCTNPLTKSNKEIIPFSSTWFSSGGREGWIHDLLALNPDRSATETHVIGVCLLSQSASEKLSQEKKPTNHHVISSKKMSAIWLFWLQNKQTFRMFSLRNLSAFLVLFTWTRRTTCAKDHGLFYLNYPQINKVGKSDHVVSSQVTNENSVNYRSCRRTAHRITNTWKPGDDALQDEAPYSCQVCQNFCIFTCVIHRYDILRNS